MAVTISANTNFNINNGTIISVPFKFSLTTSGSGQFNNTTAITSSWQQLDQGGNKDFLFGAFTNTDLTSSIYIAAGNTGSYASLLNPNTLDQCVLVNSGSSTLWAKASSGSPLLNYTLASMN